MKKYGLFFGWLLIAEISFASCFIDEVVELCDSGYSSFEIFDICNGVLDESTCTIEEVFRLKGEYMSLSSIRRSCEVNSGSIYGHQQYQRPSTRIATYCATPYGNCAMAFDVTQGSSCYCPTYNGSVWGIAR